MSQPSNYDLFNQCADRVTEILLVKDVRVVLTVIVPDEEVERVFVMDSLRYQRSEMVSNFQHAVMDGRRTIVHHLPLPDENQKDQFVWPDKK